MKKVIIFLNLFCSLHIAYAQDNNIDIVQRIKNTGQLLKALEATSNVDSLKEVLTTNINNETRAFILFKLTTLYTDNKLDSSLKYIKLFSQVPSKSKLLEANGLVITGDIFLRLGNASMAVEMLFKGAQMMEALKDSTGMGMAYWNLGKLYESLDDHTRATGYFLNSVKISSGAQKQLPWSYSLGALGLLYMNLDRLGSALYYTQSAYEIRRQMKSGKNYVATLLAQLGHIYQKSGNTDLAMKFYRSALKEALSNDNSNAAGEACIGIATLFKNDNKNDNKNDSCYYYATKGFVMAQQLKSVALILKTGDFLKDFFKDKNLPDSALKYQEIMISERDSLEKINRVHDISLAEQRRIQETEAREKEFQTKIKLYTLIISLAVFLFVAIFLYRVNRRKQKVNILLQHQKEEIQRTLAELKSTQAQLIQSEKMASLGELTAGIAHEIQNPLNFVHNFSEVNKELIEEMKEEIDKGNLEQVKFIANDIEENQDKIIHHGKRADAIVKGMLQHSKASTGKKEPTDINASCDEYLRLAYHGMRAKDKNFNAGFKTDLDESIEKINVVSQDVGRVLLNLFNNAFYAVNEKFTARRSPLTVDYVPLVSVQTKKLNDKIEIRVNDNGNGIPQNIIDKIFQPFFTTKPTGQGTGLGLSLAFDIIKAHGGEIRVETKNGEGSTFLIQLPIV